MSRRVIRLGPGECPDVETGARFFAALAFPGVGEHAARQNAIAAWVGSWLREATRAVKGCDLPFEDEYLNAFVRLPPKWCRAKLRTASRRLADRSNLARAVRPWVRELIGSPQALLPGMTEFSQRQIALYLSGEKGLRGDIVERANNFQKRVWRAGRPITHIAISQDLLLCGVGGTQTEFNVDLASVGLIGEIVKLADAVADLIIHDRRFRVSTADMLRLKWIS